MSKIKVFEQVEGQAGLTLLGVVPNSASAEDVERLMGVQRKLYIVMRKIDDEIAWLVRVKSTDPTVRTKMQRYDDIASICSFLGWLERDQPNATFGARKISEVVDAWARVSGINREKISQVLDTKLDEEH